MTLIIAGSDSLLLFSKFIYKLIRKEVFLRVNMYWNTMKF